MPRTKIPPQFSAHHCIYLVLDGGNPFVGTDGGIGQGTAVGFFGKPDIELDLELDFWLGTRRPDCQHSTVFRNILEHIR